MAPTPFERQVNEVDSDEDHVGATSSAADSPQRYEPTPSFLDQDQPEVRLAELPAWLQAFASSVGEPDEPKAPAEPDAELEPEPVVESDHDTADPEPDAPVTLESWNADSIDIGSDFISEDDLPDWLRSIAPEEPAEGTTEPRAFDRTGKSDQIAVPAVSRAWSRSEENRGADESTSLFAMVASQTSLAPLPSQEDGVALGEHDQATLHGPEGGRSGGHDSSRQPGNKPVIDLPRPADLTASPANSGSGLPVVPIVVAVILLLVLVGSAVGLFFL